MSAAVQPKPTVYQVPCPDCSKLMELRRSRFKNSWWYACPDWPSCQGCHGAHPDGKPLGKPANQETRNLRRAAHALFDPIYECYPKGKQRREARWRAYMWLAYAMGVDIKLAHIGEFDADQCRQLIALLLAESHN